MTFDYFGVVIRVNPTASDLDLVGFMLEAADVEERDEQKSIQATARYLKGLIHVDDWDTFWRQAKANRQMLPDLLLLGEGIVEAVAEIPSQPSTGSSGGRRTTDSKSKAASSSRRASRSRVKPSDARTVETVRALELVPETRPDIKEFVIQAHEARAAKENWADLTTAQRMGLTS